MILVWGVPGDSPVAAVTAALARLGQPPIFFDQHDALAAELDLCVDREVNGLLRLPGSDVDLREITGVYLRPYETSRLAAVAEAPPIIDRSPRREGLGQEPRAFGLTPHPASPED
jgi:hypothetical protein